MLELVVSNVNVETETPAKAAYSVVVATEHGGYENSYSETAYESEIGDSITKRHEIEITQMLCNYASNRTFVSDDSLNFQECLKLMQDLFDTLLYIKLHIRQN